MRACVRVAGAIALAVTLPACGAKPAARVSVPPTAVPATPTPEAALTAADLTMFITVRDKALQRLEDALDEAETSGGDVVSQVQDLGAAERDAARGLGVEWRQYVSVREHVGRLLSAQRQQEDQRLLVAELTRAKQDLEAQLAIATDAAGHQFLEAQIKSVSAQLERLGRETRAAGPRAPEFELLTSFRASLATQQGRQEHLLKRLQDVMRRTVESEKPNPAPGPRAGK